MWEISLARQTITLLFSFAIGGGYGIFYELLKVFRKALSLKTAGVFLTDLAFCFVTAFLTFLWLLARTNGEMRLYVFISLFSGFSVFKLCLGTFTFKLLFKLFKILQKSAALLSKPIYLFCLLICRFTDNIRRKSKAVLKHIKKLLKNGINVLYNKSNN